MFLKLLTVLNRTWNSLWATLPLIFNFVKNIQILKFLIQNFLNHFWPLVVSIGTNPTFKVKKVPMDYISSMPKRLHFFGSWFRLFNFTSSILLFENWTCLVFDKPGESLYSIEISMDNFICNFFSLLETNPLHLPGLKPMTGIRSQNLQLMVLTLATLRRKKVKKNNVILDFIYLWHEIKYILLYLPVL